MRVGEILKQYRMDKRISLRDFCRSIGFGSCSVSEVERGVIEPDTEFIDSVGKIVDRATFNKLIESWFGSSNVIPQKKHEPAFPPSINGQKPTKDQVDLMTKLINK